MIDVESPKGKMLKAFLTDWDLSKFKEDYEVKVPVAPCRSVRASCSVRVLHV